MVISSTGSYQFPVDPEIGSLLDGPLQGGSG